MQILEFDLDGEYVELKQLLKLADLVTSGGEAKKVIGDASSYVEEGRFDPQAKKWHFNVIPAMGADKIKTSGQFWVEPRGDNSFVVYGDLTIKDVTKEIALEASYLGSGKNPWGVEVAGFEAKTSFNRKDFGLTWNQALESGGVLVSDEVKLNLEIQAQRVEDQA